MDQPENVASTTQSWGLSGDDAREALRQHREHLLRYANVPAMPADDSPAGADSREEPGLSVDDLPEQLQRLVRSYERDWPEVRLVPRGYIATGPTGDALPSIGLGEVPADDELVSFAVTETVMSSKSVQVRTHLFIAARVPSAVPPGPEREVG